MNEHYYSKRTWLNPIEKDGTSAVVAFDGKVSDWKGREYPSTFIEISDCQRKIRLHYTPDDDLGDFIEKLQLLKSEIDLFINHLEHRSWV